MPCLNYYSPLVVICVIYLSGGPAKATISGLIGASLYAYINLLFLCFIILYNIVPVYLAYAD